MRACYENSILLKYQNSSGFWSNRILTSIKKHFFLILHLIIKDWIRIFVQI